MGEIGLDFSGDFVQHRAKQESLLRNLLRFYHAKKLTTKVLIFHCRDAPGSTAAGKLLCDIVEKELPCFDRSQMKMHYHCFNGSHDLYLKWRAAVPQMRYGVAGIVLREEKHPDLEKVLELLDPCQILLETDSPHLTVPTHGKGFNTPYGLVEVTRRVGEITHMSTEEVLRVAAVNTRELYNLSQ